MPNKSAAKEWLVLSQHDLQAAETLFENHHFNDTIGFLLQQAAEKSLKSICAYKNEKIRKTHDLVEIYSSVALIIPLDEEEMDLLDILTEYYTSNRYPHSNYSLPDNSEIQSALDFVRKLYKRINSTIE